MNILSVLRHSRGFGVHSPFAFRFITETLCLPRGVRYYAEDLYPRNRVFRFVHRSIAALQPRSVYLHIPEGVGDTVRRAVILADSRIPLDSPRPDMLIVVLSTITDAATLDQLRDIAANARYVLIIIPCNYASATATDIRACSLWNHPDQEATQAAETILGACPGMTLTNLRGFILRATRRDLPHQTIPVWF